MRRWGACVLVLLCVCLGGCLSGDPEQASALLNRLHLPRTTLGPDGALLDLALVERPFGDPFLNDELWHSTDSQVAGLEKKALLDDNGFWVGQVVGMNPAKLQDLIESKRYCVTSRRQVLSAGTPTVVALGPAVPQCNFRVKTQDGAHDVVLDQGQCALNIVPSLTNDGRTRLKFTPQVLYGGAAPDVQVAPDRTGYLYQCKRPSKTYDALSWEVILAPNQYLVIGTHSDENTPEDVPQSLGNQCFLVENDRTYGQRVLVIRSTRGGEVVSGVRNQGSGVRGQESGIRDQESGVRGDVDGAAGNLTGTAPCQPIAPAAHCLQCCGS